MELPVEYFIFQITFLFAVSAGYYFINLTRNFFDFSFAATYTIGAIAYYVGYVTGGWLLGIATTIMLVCSFSLLISFLIEKLKGKMDSESLVIASLCLYLILVNSYSIIFHDKILTLNFGVDQYPVFVNSRTQIFLTMICLGLIVWATWYFNKRTLFGIRARAFQNNEDLLSELGISVRAPIIATTLVGAMLLIVAIIWHSTRYNISVNTAFTAFTYSVIVIGLMKEPTPIKIIFLAVIATFSEYYSSQVFPNHWSWLFMLTVVTVVIIILNAIKSRTA